MEVKVRQMSGGEAQLLAQASRFLRRLGLARRLRENGLAAGLRWGTRVVMRSYVNAGVREWLFRLPTLPYPRQLSEPELERRFQCEPFRIGARTAEKSGWIRLPGDLWLTAWNVELALREAKLEYNRRWEAFRECLGDLIGQWRLDRTPALVEEHLAERYLWRPKSQLRNGLKCELLRLFGDREIERLDWAIADLARYDAWWRSVEYEVRAPRRDKTGKIIAEG